MRKTINYAILVIAILSIYAIFKGAFHHIGTLILCLILFAINSINPNPQQQ